MGKLTAKGEATRERIVAAAADLIYANGVERTSTQEVERAAGVSSSQIYHYFRDKRSLVKAVIAFQAERIVGLNEQLLAPEGGLAGLQEWRDAVVAMQKTHGLGGCPVGSLASELADRDTEARIDLAAGFARWEQAIRTLLQAMKDRGELRPEADPDQLAMALLTALQGGLLLSQTRHDTVALEAVLDTMLDRIRHLTPPRC